MAHSCFLGDPQRHLGQEDDREGSSGQSWFGQRWKQKEKAEEATGSVSPAPHSPAEPMARSYPGSKEPQDTSCHLRAWLQRGGLRLIAAAGGPSPWVGRFCHAGRIGICLREKQQPGHWLSWSTCPPTSLALVSDSLPLAETCGSANYPALLWVYRGPLPQYSIQNHHGAKVLPATAYYLSQLLLLKPTPWDSDLQLSMSHCL